ncbi:hypothetical protein BDN70DRAFT_901893 [Pholiota conissans]|uniref:Uncharacterized protein n=1 Tax=Pholiota conissans TaxID=109636 RepID=A0A9P6CR09_9AGAR|nr:hypothetical protein BDN70DRAFT_901893 [Pholiota conissans]
MILTAQAARIQWPQYDEHAHDEPEQQRRRRGLTAGKRGNTRDKQDPAYMSDETARTARVSERSSGEYDNDAHGGDRHDSYDYDMRRQVSRARRVSKAAGEASGGH